MSQPPDEPPPAPQFVKKRRGRGTSHDSVAGTSSEPLLPAPEATKPAKKATWGLRVGSEIDVPGNGEVPSIESLRGLVIGHVNKPTLAEAAKQCRPGERPRFLIGTLNSGALVAFEDRCLIVKKGIATSLVAGSFGGGRVSTFQYTGVTGIEYNSGLFNGVLEVLTASYQGTANKDFWKGTLSGRNANASDPFTISNTLPLPKNVYELARDHITWLQERVANANARSMATALMPLVAPPSPESTTTAAAGDQPAVSLADEIRKLAELRDAGILTDAEFAEAKRALLNGSHG